MFILFRIAMQLVWLALLAWVGGAIALFAIMWLPPADFSAWMGKAPRPVMMAGLRVLPFERLWNIARAGALREGDPAPDFDLPRPQNRAERVKLSGHFGERPVVLVFGSYTGPPFRREVPVLNKIYAEYKDRAAFYVVYIEEAHTSDLWQLPANEKQGVIFAAPKSEEERAGLAEACVRNLKIDIPAVVDSLQNLTERAYTAWPDRLVVIDKYGRVQHISKPGPYGFKPGGMEAALKKVL